ncbi:MAG TPA: adenosine kinase [Acidimicrobiales bacterium]
MTEKSLHVVAIGSAIVDVLAHADEAFLADHGMVKGSMQLIDEDTAHRLYADMAPAIEASGGSAGNTAAGLASLGARVGFVGRVRDDQLGEVFGHDIRSMGVDFRAPAATEGPATARCLILLTSDAERTMNTFLGAASLLTPHDIDESYIASAEVVYCEGYLWDVPEAKAALVKAMDIARASATKVAFTLSDSFCVDRHRAEFLELAEHRVDILFANESEICSLYEVDTFDEAAERVAGHCEIACLTRSEKGSVIITSDGQRVAVPAHPHGPLVDTTGAGDLYAAGFLYGLTRGDSLERCGQIGSLAAGEVISHVGARPGVDLNELVAAELPA